MDTGLDDKIQQYLNLLPKADPNKAVFLLRKLEGKGKNKRGISQQIFPLLYHDHYLVRSRAFITMGRLEDKSVSYRLVAYIGEDVGEEWQIRALECLFYLKDQEVVPKLADFLSNIQCPLLVRGVVWLMGYLGGKEALDKIVSFAISPLGRIVKNEVILEAVSLAIHSFNDGSAYFQELKRKNPIAERYFRYCVFDDSAAQPRFSVLPYPDYFLDQALSRGIYPRVFKKLSYWDRDSHGKKEYVL
ncbi:MAG: HEAT repeat domain-containing protein [Bacillota bacterium]